MKLLRKHLIRSPAPNLVIYKLVVTKLVVVDLISNG